MFRAQRSIAVGEPESGWQAGAAVYDAVSVITASDIDAFRAGDEHAVRAVYRELIRLQHLQGYTHTQISEILGVPVGTVKSRSFRIHKVLAARLGHLREEAVP